MSALALKRSFHGRLVAWLSERAIVLLLFLSASVATLATLAIFLVLLLNGIGFFRQVSPAEFLFGTTWSPDFYPPRFGALPLLKGTIQIGLGAAVLGVPIGVGTAVYLSEFASEHTRRLVKPAIELLAGIPSIVFGIIALFVIGTFLNQTFGIKIFNALNATIVLGVMVIPIITSLSEDALRAVPRELREGALALGATQWESTSRVVIPAASSGITAAILLGFSRAIGETMAVAMAGGLIANMRWNYLAESETITAYVANRAGGDLPQGSLAYLSIFAVGIVLFLITFVINVIAQFVMTRQRRRFS